MLLVVQETGVLSEAGFGLFGGVAVTAGIVPGSPRRSPAPSSSSGTVEVAAFKEHIVVVELLMLDITVIESVLGPIVGTPRGVGRGCRP
ncbi:hypothetical protein ACIQWB_32045 [Streptomyces olivaceus]|uniref:hypothetical protein n=1 Tax=Streptomyces olivaceus TaxID=47716 RepID=UPI00382C650D